MLHQKSIWFIGLLVTFFNGTLFSQPVLIKKIDISAAGTGKRMLLGDVTGDGRLEMVMMQADNMADDRYIGHEVNCLTVYDCEGKKLWQVGDPAKGASAGSDIPAQVYDIDQDGFNEVLACMNGKLRIFNGKDGKEESTFSYPHQNDHAQRIRKERLKRVFSAFRSSGKADFKDKHKKYRQSIHPGR